MSTPLLVSSRDARRLGLGGSGSPPCCPCWRAAWPTWCCLPLGQDPWRPSPACNGCWWPTRFGITSSTGGGGPARGSSGGGVARCLGTGVCAGFPAVPWPFHQLAHCRSHLSKGAACMLVLSLAIAAGAEPPGPTGLGMGWLGTPSACGTALGPSRRPVDRRTAGRPLPAAAPLTLLALGCAWRICPG